MGVELVPTAFGNDYCDPWFRANLQHEDKMKGFGTQGWRWSVGDVKQTRRLVKRATAVRCWMNSANEALW